MVCLIFGPRKGGTSLLQRLIDNNNVFSHPTETNIKHYKKLQHILNEDSDEKPFFSKYEKYFYTRYEKDIGLDKERYQSHIVESLKDVKTLKDYVLLHVRATVEASNNINKDVSVFFIKEVSGDIEKIFAEFLEEFEDGKIVSLRRNPRWVARAVLTDRGRRGIKLGLNKKIRQIVDPIYIDKQQIKFVDNPRVITETYEDLIENTEVTMTKIMNFCGCSMENENLVPTICGRPTVVVTSSKNEGKVFQQADKKLWDDVSKLDYLLLFMGPIFYFIIRLLVNAKSEFHRAFK
ncbi:hypothetical protein Tel_08585 [Candidatus Tenderia electrophaga]|jgi:hypothetical protein|uniref:Sulfotransferase domain-containing protein n=1 Tax=Candidatus Tenderia electrophaga TaxID=1748243 RepID=A0A0S2TDJ5_9GAMM|nr:hypothetical protein Tel_08585 [Candidatus Tenderia electrophaga]